MSHQPQRWSKTYEPYGKATHVDSGLVYQIVFPKPGQEMKDWQVVTCANEKMRDFQLEMSRIAYHKGRGMRWQQDENLSRFALEV